MICCKAIKKLQTKADSKHRKMLRSLHRADCQYRYGRRAKASTYSEEGHRHYQQYLSLRAQIAAMNTSIQEAFNQAQAAETQIDDSAFWAAHASYHAIKNAYHALKQNPVSPISDPIPITTI